jgi:hypothetical protein
MQKTTKKMNGSPNEDTQQSTKTRTPNKTQEECDERNVDALLKIPKAIVNVFGTLDWVIEEGWQRILKK